MTPSITNGARRLFLFHRYVRSIPDLLVRLILGGAAFAFEQLSRGFAAAGNLELAARIAKAFVDGMHRQSKVPCQGLCIVPAHDQAQRLLLLFGQ